MSQSKTYHYAELALPVALKQFWTYGIPQELLAKLKIGMRVLIPFRNHLQIGVVCKLHQSLKPLDGSIKLIRECLDTEPILDEHMLALILWMSRYYGSSPGMAIQAALPAGLNFQAQEHLRVREGANPYGLSKAAATIFDCILEEQLSNRKSLEMRFRGKEGIIKRMLKDGLIESIHHPVQRTREATETWLLPTEGAQQRLSELPSRKSKWTEFLASLFDQPLPIPLEEVKNMELYSSFTLKKATDEGFFRKEERPLQALEEHFYTRDFSDKLLELNAEQQQAFEKIRSTMQDDNRASTYETFLLHGITGSGKTEVYMHAIAHALQQGQSAMVLVPEIALTPQTLNRFKRVFGDIIISLHSRQTNRERLTAWKAIARGRYRIVLGPRSAVFAPLVKPGILIVDEEHDGSYRQQDPEPRYHARDVAIMRANMLGIPIVLGSATPNMVSMHRAMNGKFKLLKLKNRHGQASLPTLKLLDMKAYQNAMSGPFTAAMRLAIDERLSLGEQIILLLNRRGYGAYVQSEKTGEIAECPNCSVSLTYHKAQNAVRCHYCGYSTSFNRLLRQYGEEHTRIQGSGTQQVEEAIGRIFPQAKSLRMDQDTTSAKDGHEDILKRFGAGEADILLGTQMVAKGLDFPNVTLVGILNADSELGFPLFNAAERSYQLLSQVAGRSGRAAKKGEVLLQSWQPMHPVFQYVQKHDFEGFYEWEISNRRSLHYPPFTKLMVWHLKGLDGTTTANAAQKLKEVLMQRWLEWGGTHEAVLGPSPALIMKQHKRWCWDLMLKLPSNWQTKQIEQLQHYVMNDFENGFKDSPGNDLRIAIDIDLK